MKVSSELVDLSRKNEGLYWDLGKAENCRKEEGVGMDQKLFMILKLYSTLGAINIRNKLRKKKKKN